MDSLTQLTLGAAVGEVVLGKKIGNRAMMWGAVAGTIPDLDVFSGLWMNPLDTLSFHRGPSHSITFAILFPLLIGAYTHWIYRTNLHKHKGFKIPAFAVGIIFIGFVQWIMGGMLFEFFGLTPTIVGLAVTVPIGLYIIYRMWKYYLMKESDDVSVSYKAWYWFFFWTTVTHPLLDNFTVFGTRFLWPFSNVRVAFSNISVADPLYTFPFLGLLIVAAFMRRGSIKRSRFNMAGIVVSSLYMIFTIFNQGRVEKVLKASLAEDGIEYSRTLITPTILNNVLWYCAAETDSAYYQGMYSFFDKEKKVVLSPIPSNRHWIEGREEDETIKRLDWFSNGFYSLLRRTDGRIQLNDMRYGTFRGNSNSENDYIFYFILNELEDGSFEIEETEPGPPEGEARDLMGSLWARIFGDVEAISDN